MNWLKKLGQAVTIDTGPNLTALGFFFVTVKYLLGFIVAIVLLALAAIFFGPTLLAIFQQLLVTIQALAVPVPLPRY